MGWIPIASASYPDARLPALVHFIIQNLQKYVSVILSSDEMAYPGCYALLVPSISANLISSHICCQAET
jgi:hypothetical protein